jgi:aspartyl/asparaginyl beta-hydroxylase (cupin superfamily)
MSNQPTPWFSHHGRPFKGSEPFFFDTTDFSWVARIEAQWPTIRDELQPLMREHESSMVPYPNHALTTRPDRWKTFGFMFWTIRSRENISKCPKTWALLSSIPNVIAASFNLLEPGTTIKPHQGDTNAIVRCHLGLVIPAAAPECAFRVGSVTRSWEEGKFLMFCDAHTHTAWNNTNERRYIMIVDVMRPEFVPQTKSVCSRVLANIYLEIMYQRIGWLRRYFSEAYGKSLVFVALKAWFQLALFTRMTFRTAVPS